jgi:calcineurin-like phosphoesterase family protein
VDNLGHLTHYGHKNICRGVTDWRMPDGSIPIEQTRDFKTVDEMNEAIVNNINKVVGQDDVLFHLGDVSFGGIDQLFKFRERIICKNIHLVYGNHDQHIKKNNENSQSLFLSVNDRIELRINKRLMIFDHYPISSWEELKKGSIMCHGHSHLPNNKKISIGRRIDIGIDGNLKFQPYNLIRDCFNVMSLIPVSSGFNNDHHLDNIR